MQENKAKTVSLLRGLNTAQKEAVAYTDGPSLILAGAGSGKTKVLTHKVAYLIDRRKISPAAILALTFTNKAAREMQYRISKLIKHQIKDLWCSTFHSFFARILRRDCNKLGFTPDFVIYDEKDQLELIKSIINNVDIGFKTYPASAIRAKISHLKNRLVLPEDLAKIAPNNQFEEHVAIIYPEYQNRLKRNNSMDFDDLLLKPIELFLTFPQILQYYQNQWKYILVDEYQDTNYPQYVLLKLLSAKHRNLSVVGDDDQSIYRWRGANIQNILEFEKDFPDCKIFRLEQNYRSTGNILAVANSIISNNSSRMEKQLWTQKDTGEHVTILVSLTGEEEALKIVTKIQQEVYHHKRNFSDFAILYRTNAQSRVLEAGLRTNGIAYVIVAGTRFYERKEVKDVLAYLRIVCNPLDEVSIKRIINYPLRGIGDATIIKIEKFCLQNHAPFIEGIRRIAEINGISDKIKEKAIEFYQMISKYRNLRDSISAIELATTLVEELGILRQFKEEGTEEALNRRANILELLTEINQFSLRARFPTLSGFLEEVSLIMDIDNWDDRANAVTLMTLHSAKGLEFPVVFIAGLEEGLLPLSRSLSLDEDIEEERRLFYVGTTRAKEMLYLLYATQRQRYGETFSGKKSRFIEEINKHLLQIDNTSVYIKRATEISTKKSYPQQIPLTYESRQRLLKVGALVQHPHFGKGVIRNLEGEGENKKAVIIFEELGEKKVVIQYANLEIL